MVLRDRYLDLLWQGGSVAPAKLMQEKGILEKFEVLVDVVDDRPFNQDRLDYSVKTDQLPKLPVRWVELEKPGKVLLVDGPEVKILGFSKTLGQPAVREIATERFCRVVNLTKKKLPEPFEGFCELANDEEP